MNVIEVLAPGLFTTVQDLGRLGFGAMAVSASGAADTIALRLGNRLVGNDENAAGLEMTLVGGTFRFPHGGVVALTGSDFDATLDGSPVAVWTSLHVRPGQTLATSATRSGARGYLCVQGGVAVELILGSASTHALSKLGGFEGRALKKGDVLNVGSLLGVSQIAADHKRMIALEVLRRLIPRRVLRVTAGPQRDWFSESSRRAFHENAFRVAEESNRMGLRLEGISIAAPVGREMITEGVSLGAIQVPANGQPIILFVEQQTTGGYPKIANVISADLHAVGQLRPRDEIRFELVAMETARSLLKEQERLLSSPELLLA
jgi:antagonist of KipI